MVFHANAEENKKADDSFHATTEENKKADDGFLCNRGE